MATITFDCDEVLAELMQYTLVHHNNTFAGVPLQWDEITDYYIENIPKFGHIAFEEAKKIFDDILLHHSVEKVSPVVGMYDIVASLKQLGHQLYVVTARGDEMQRVTMQWIEKHFPAMFNDVVFANHYNDRSRCKGDICDHLGSSLMIEDTIHNAHKTAHKGILTLVPSKPWNKNHNFVAENHMLPIDSINTLHNILKKQGFLDLNI